jgi:hypothetical protein
MTRTEMKEKAQEEIMIAIANFLGHSKEIMDARGEWVGDENADEFRTICHREAHRVAKLMGYDEAWSN